MTTNHADLPGTEQPRAAPPGSEQPGVEQPHAKQPVSDSRGAEQPQSSVRALSEMLALFAVTAAIWLVHLYGRTLPTAALLAVWAALGLSISAALFRRARIRRDAFLTAYIDPASPLRRSLRGGWLMAARQLLLAAALALLLLVALIRLDDTAAWVVLIASVPVVVIARRLLRRAALPHVSRAYLPEMTWRLTIGVAGGLMLLAFVALAFHRPYPELGDVSLERAVWHLVDQERARSAGAEILLQMAAVKDALRLWLAQQLMPQPGMSLVQALGWLLVLAEEALFVWSYLLLCSAALASSRRR